MTEQLSTHSSKTELTDAPGMIVLSPSSVADLLARIDAILDELYAIRQTVREWAGNPADSEQGDSLHETSLAVSPVLRKVVGIAPISHAVRKRPVADERIEAARVAAAALPASSLTRQLAGSLGPGSPDEVIYTNAEIVHMRFGDEWP